MPWDLLGALVVISIAGVIGRRAYNKEKRIWNDGICAENGLPWTHFDNDSQGGRGYKAGDQTCWISWPEIDKRS